MKPEKIYRYHCFDEDGKKIIREFTEEPADKKWRPGNGPLTQEQYARCRDRIERTFTGVSKTPEQRIRMSIAKTGVAKSSVHRANMQRAHRERAEKIRQLMIENPDLNYNEANRMLSEIMRKHK